MRRRRSGWFMTVALAALLVSSLLLSACSTSESDVEDAIGTASDLAPTALAAVIDDAADATTESGTASETVADAHEESSTAAAEHHADTVHYGYGEADGPEHWATLSSEWGICATGEFQSPINLTDAVVAEDAVLPDITFNYQESPLSIYNNGHTIQAAYHEGSSIMLGTDEYTLVQFHFHAHSEHTIDGEPTPLEIHFVHSMSQGEGQPARLAVVGVLITEGAAHPAYDALMQHLPTEVTAEAAPVDGVTINADAMLPEDRTFYHYSGSLTTPSCSEGVSWQVLTTPIELSAEQIAAFTTIHDDNFRPVQPIGDREVQVSGP